MQRRNLYVAIVLAGVVIAIFAIFCNCNLGLSTTFWLVRHAEKVSNDTNANLSSIGGDRARELVEAAKDAGVSAIYTTEFCRTAQTAQPLANQLSLSLIVQDNGIPGDQLSDSECDPDVVVPIERLPITIDTIEELVGEILSKNSGEVVLIVGHSDSVPQIIEELGVDWLCPYYFPVDAGNRCFIPGDQFDNIFKVYVFRFWGIVRMVRARY